MPTIIASGGITRDVVVERRNTVVVPGQGTAVRVADPDTVLRPVEQRARTVGVSSTGPQGPKGETGGIVDKIAVEILGGHRVVRSTGATTAGYASADNPLHGDDTLGVTTGAAMQGAPVAVRILGQISFNGWSWTPGEPVFLGINGVLTQVAPGAGFVQVIGHAEAADTIFVNVQPPIYHS